MKVSLLIKESCFHYTSESVLDLVDSNVLREVRFFVYFNKVNPLILKHRDMCFFQW